MRIRLVTAAKWLARFSGLIALALGTAYWLGMAVPLHAHMFFGGLLALALFILAYGGRKRTALLSLLAVAGALVIPATGVLQLHLPGIDHQWAARLAHVILGLGGIGLAERLAASTLAKPKRS